jgi:hypothetical protein
MRTDNPILDHLRHEDRLYEALIQRPRCECCDEHIQDDELYDFDGTIVCPSCLVDYLNDNHKKQTVAYIS